MSHRIKESGVAAAVVLFTVWLWVPGLLELAWALVPIVGLAFAYAIIHNSGNKE